MMILMDRLNKILMIKSKKGGESMKKCFFVFFCAVGLLLLAGCGKNANEVKCSKTTTESDTKVTIEVIATLDKNDKISNVSMVYDLGDADTAKTYCDVFKKSEDSKSKNVSCSGTKITFKDLDSFEEDEEEDSKKLVGESKDNFIKAAKEEGFTCK